MAKRLLDIAAKNPQMIQSMSICQLEVLASEIRKELVNTVSQTGGHLASNLGVVELTLALMHVLNVPNDKIVWDVGHQCYTYKLLTNRLERFSTLRQENGISGFPKTEESRYDSFISGHASTSIAVAYGLKRAASLSGRKENVAAVIGDGSFTGGMIYEGLNNVGKSRENLIIVLNDNEMAISRNEGAFAKYLSIMRSKPEYFKLKKLTEKALLSVPLAGEGLRDFVAGSKSLVKQIIYPSTFFEELGFTYFGPVDGHNLDSLCEVLCQARDNTRPSLVHIQTRKGKGYSFAEKEPGRFHGISKFNVQTGEGISTSTESFSDVFGKTLAELAEKDNRICAITAAMEHGTALQHFARRFKRSGRYFDVGIAEEFGVTFASALAAGDMLPVFAVYSTFLQRGYDQLIHDASIEKRHVVFGVDRAGIVGDDGETHQGIFDVAFLSTIFGMTVLSPSNFNELRGMLNSALYDYNSPVAVRYPRGAENEAVSDYKYTGESFDIIENGGESLVITYGRTFAAALEAAGKRGADILKLNRVTPIDPLAIKKALGYKKILFVEEAVRLGGAGMQFAALLAESGFNGRIKVHAIEEFVPQSSVNSALARLSLDSAGIEALIINM